MENNENVVLEGTENVEGQATETLVDGAKVSEGKMYTDEEIAKLVNEKVDQLLPKKLERAKSKMERDFGDKYERLERVVKAGLEVDSLEEATDQLEQFYVSKGTKIPERTYSDSDVKYLAERYANEIIEDGYDEVVNEVRKLSSVGLDNMTPYQKAMFMKLSESRKEQEDLKELASIGVGKEELEDSEYKEFARKLSPDLSAKEKYEMFRQFKPKEKFEPIGSMKSASNQQEVKDFYTYEESLKFTKADFDKNPKLYEAVEKSMYKW